MQEEDRAAERDNEQYSPETPGPYYPPTPNGDRVGQGLHNNTATQHTTTTAAAASAARQRQHAPAMASEG